MTRGTAAAWVPSGWSSSRLLSGTAGPTMMEDARTSVAKKGLPTSPAMSRATEKPGVHLQHLLID